MTESWIQTLTILIPCIVYGYYINRKYKKDLYFLNYLHKEYKKNIDFLNYMQREYKDDLDILNARVDDQMNRMYQYYNMFVDLLKEKK